MKLLTQLKQLSLLSKISPIKNLIKTLKISAVSVSLLLMPFASASTAFTANNLYHQQNYEQARIAYLDAAKLGNPHVYYQLGTIYYKGEGIKSNLLSSIIWFSLAAEYQYNDSENIVAQLIATVAEDHRTDVYQLIESYKKTHGKKAITEKYLPQTITANLNKKVTFGREGSIDNHYENANELFDFNEVAESFSEDLTFDGSDDIEEGESFDDSYDQTTRSIKKDPSQLPFLAVIDYDIAPDGSIRNITNSYMKGRAANLEAAIHHFSLHSLPAPTFDGKRINFIHRGYLGIASYPIDKVKTQHKNFYDWGRRTIKKLKQSEVPQDRFKYAMALIYFPWIIQEEGTAPSILKALAEEGHVKAQFEYGLYLYREQIDPEQALKWLSLASQFGLTKAQYHLARILQDSPWVVEDETKALFWYEKAAENKHSTASLKLAEIKLLANDESLRDQASAIETLKSIEQAQEENPEYHYLVAVSHLTGEFRDFSKVVKHLRLAISQGQTLNWDVSNWEEQLAQWTTGNVTIKDN